MLYCFACDIVMNNLLLNKGGIMFKLFIALIFGIILLSCTSNYLVTYDTYLSNSKTKSLTFKDDKFLFRFFPVANGIYFNVRNLTQTPATLIWDRCYFIAPDNNSSKLINTDVIYEEEETKRKAKYESILPPGADFARFTSSALNVEKFTNIKNQSVGHYLQIFDTNILTTYENIEYQEFLSYGRYWPDIGRIKKSKFNDELKRVYKYVDENNNMGLGLAIKLNEDLLDYKFDFKFNKVSVYKVASVNPYSRDYNETDKKIELEAWMDDESGWKWKFK